MHVLRSPGDNLAAARAYLTYVRVLPSITPSPAAWQCRKVEHAVTGAPCRRPPSSASMLPQPPLPHAASGWGDSAGHAKNTPGRAAPRAPHDRTAAEPNGSGELRGGGRRGAWALRAVFWHQLGLNVQAGRRQA